MIRRFELTGELGIAPGESDAGNNVRSSLLEDRTLRAAFSVMATVTSSTISDATDNRPLPGEIPKSPVNSNLRIKFFKLGMERGPLRII